MSFSFASNAADPHGTHHSSPNSMHHQQYVTSLPGSSSSSSTAGGSPTGNAQVQAAAAAAAAAAQAAANMPLLASIANVKDSRWLTLEVCREYQRGKCTRSEQECKFAHPPTHVEVNSGKVIACFDSLKVRTAHACCRSSSRRKTDSLHKDIYPVTHTLVVKLIRTVKRERPNRCACLFVYFLSHLLTRAVLSEHSLSMRIHTHTLASITTFSTGSMDRTNR